VSVRKTLLELRADRAQKDPAEARKLYGHVADLVRSRLAPEDAAIVAPWFDRLATGEALERVFPSQKKRGRPKDATRLDDIDIAWICRQHIDARTLKPREVYAGVAKAHRLQPATVANIYSRIKRQEGW
jgi:hypothetical protein